MAKKLHFKEVTIRNFRSFKHFNAADFGQLNLITGRNNSGKTTLLEGMFLALGPGNPELWTNINGRRGILVVGKQSTSIPYLFHKLNTNVPIIFEIDTKDYSSYTVEIRAEESSKVIPISMPTGTYSSTDQNTNVETDYSSLSITYKPTVGDPVISTASFGRDEIQFSRAISIFPDSVFLSPEGRLSQESEARRYDLLNKKGLTHRFENFLRQFLPDLKRTSFGLENDVPTVLVDVGFGLVPLSLLGSGARRLATIILAISVANNTIVLIDEIESGFHHSIYEDVWRSIVEFAQSQNTQIFATTHSDEFIRSSIGVLQKSEVNFKLHRMSIMEDVAELKTFAKDEFEAAVEGGWDVR